MALDSTPRSDYAHWNEDQDYMWYMEVGRFTDTEEPTDLAWDDPALWEDDEEDPE